LSGLLACSIEENVVEQPPHFTNELEYLKSHLEMDRHPRAFFKDFAGGVAFFEKGPLCEILEGDSNG
jgi:4-amino-4-deoxy-L-arabinose transferase-like glycosyltransferase